MLRILYVCLCMSDIFKSSWKYPLDIQNYIVDEKCSAFLQNFISATMLHTCRLAFLEDFEVRLQ